MSKTAITSPELAPPVGPFSQAVKIDGFLFFSGQVAQDPATGKVVEGGIVPETERVFQNLSAVLKAAGSQKRFGRKTGPTLQRAELKMQRVQVGWIITDLAKARRFRRHA